MNEIFTSIAPAVRVNDVRVAVNSTVLSDAGVVLFTV